MMTITFIQNVHLFTISDMAIAETVANDDVSMTCRKWLRTGQPCPAALLRAGLSCTHCICVQAYRALFLFPPKGQNTGFFNTRSMTYTQ